MRTCIAERGATTIPHTHPLVVAGCVLPVDVVRLDWNHWQFTPEQEHAELVARFEMFPTSPLAIKLHGAGKLSCDCLNADTTGKATVDQVWAGMLVNRLDVTAEAANLNPFAKLYSGGPKADWILADFEPGSIIWVPDCPTDPDLAAKWLNAYERRNDLLTRIFTTPKVRKYIGNDISDVPWEAGGIIDCFNWMHNPNFDRHQCALMKWMNGLYMRAMKDLLSMAGMWGPKCVMAFQGRWGRGFKDSVWTLPQTPLAGPMVSNWQLYSQGFKDFPNKYAGSKSVRWVPTWSGDTEPDELRTLLEVCTGDAAILYCERPDVAERLAVVVGKWIGGAR